MVKYVGATISSAPAKIILFGEHAVNRQQPALATAIDLRTRCRVVRRDDGRYSLRMGDHFEQDDLGRVHDFKLMVDDLRAHEALDQIRDVAQDFFAPTRYVLGHVLAQLPRLAADAGFEVEWRSLLPIGSGLGSGAAASTAMVQAIYGASGAQVARAAIVQAAWQGDMIAHGGVASSLDSSTAAFGGLIRYTVAAGAEVLPIDAALAIVVGDTLVQHNTAALNTHVRRWLEEQPVRMHHFREMGWLVQQATQALQRGDVATLGTLMNLHQLVQEKLGTSVLQAEKLIDAALGAGALGAKISGSGGGGVIIALVEPAQAHRVVAAINDAGGRGYAVTAGAVGVRLEDARDWDAFEP